MSVRSRQEALDAIRGGADWVDAKEPTAGALGAVADDELRRIVQAVGEERPLSAAAGEAVDHATPGRVRTALGLGVRAAKIGTAAAACDPAAIERIGELFASDSIRRRLAMAAYADWRDCDGLPPEEVLRLTADWGGAWMLVDTHAKQSGDLFSHLEPKRIALLARTAREQGVALLLAGSLDESGVARAVGLGAALVGVRGAACDGDREATLSAALVSRLSLIVKPEGSPNQAEHPESLAASEKT
ncbi:(5-formylfuran-3-yl)methyl phosphate synthase [Pseudobythopirellula maris]|uniref:(5-formylfuran-3-yl)methyl phosphate synthase n=1 Tax=Pseudobythopirellula maris TaxID=2527991 RepID=UPI0018D37C1C|nr:(5-formylfuran-3-yl)methyl phosphate synthase [Pseudobythopirellula maris]